MSVETRRLAAAQRTAARKTSGAVAPRRRWLRLASWLVIVPTLALFSFSVVAGAAGFGAQPDYVSAVTKLAAGQPVIVLDAGSSKQVCTVNATQLKAISARWRTGRISVTIDGTPIDLVTVYGASETDMRATLGVPAMTCRLVRVATVFFLPFDAHTS
jgi:hypothetical protein